MDTPFTPHDLLRYQSIADLHCTGAAAHAACAVRRTDENSDGYASAIWLLPLDGGAAVQFTSGVASDSYPRWSPDGSQLAFISSRGSAGPQVYVIPRDGGEARQVTRMQRGVVSLAWAPDSSRLVVTAPVPVNPEARGARQPESSYREGSPRVVWRLPYKSDGVGFVLDREIHLFIVDVASGTSTRLTDGAFDVRAVGWSPDGAHIVHTRTRTGRQAHRTDVWVIDAAGGHERQLSRNVASCQYPIWSPDGRWIAFTGSEDEGDSQMRLWRIDVATGDVAAWGDESIEIVSGDAVHWVPDASGLVFVQARRGLQEVARLALDGTRAEVLVTGERHVLALAVTAERLVYTATSAVEPIAVHACDWRGCGEQRIASFNDWWNERSMPHVSLRSFDVPDGEGGTEQVEGWLLLPPADRRGPWPLLIDVHGGPHSIAFVEYQKHPYRHVLASRGWAVLALNPVGSSSYGRDFADRLRGRWGQLDLPQHLAAAEQLRAEGLVDHRLAIAGKSYGGYMAAWAIGNTTGFRAAVVSAPVSNLPSHFGTSDTGYYVTPYALGGEPYLVPDVTRRVSPIAQAHRVTTPTLILQGTDDARCPVGQSEELFATLVRSGDTPVEMVLYPGGDHHVLEEGAPSLRVDYVTRIVDWLEQWTRTAGDELHARPEGDAKSSAAGGDRDSASAALPAPG